MSKSIKIVVERQPENSYSVKIFAPDGDVFAEAIEMLKFIIPVSFRSYNPTKKAWIILNPNYLDYWFKALDEQFDLFVEETPNDLTEEYKPELKQAYNALFLLESAPTEVVKASYKALSRLYHPDISGHDSHDKQVKINQAFQEIIGSKL